jgi:hypothetical protein
MPDLLVISIDKNVEFMPEFQKIASERELGRIMLEMHTYEGLEDDLLKYDSIDHFTDYYMEKRKVVYIPFFVGTVLDFVIKKRVNFNALGIYDEEIKLNVERIIDEKEFKDLCLYINGSGHKDFFKQEIEPLFLEKFDKVTYYKSSS